LSTTACSSWSTTSCSSSEIAGPVGRVADVGVGDRLALDPDFLAAHGDGLGDLVLDDVLAQPGTAGLALRGADAQLLLGARHRVVRGGAGGVVADRLAVRVDPGAGAALGQPGIRARLAVVEPVVLIQRRLVLLGELAVGVHVRSVLDLRLLVGHAQGAAVLAGFLERHERRLGTEEAGVHQRPLGLVGLRVEIDLLDLAELVAITVIESWPRVSRTWSR
jgi:hypothetical protein